MPGPRLGSEARLLISVADNTADPLVLVPFDGTNHTSMDLDNFAENVRVTDEDNNTSSTKIDATDREAAREGFETEIAVSSKGEISFTMFNIPGDQMVDFFTDAANNRTFIPAWAADGDPSTASTSNKIQGLLANFSVEMRKSRPVKGLQTLAVTMTAATKPINYSITTALTSGA